MKPYGRIIFRWISAIGLITLAGVFGEGPAYSEDAASTAAASAVTPEMLLSLAEHAGQSTDLDPTAKKSLTDTCTQAMDLLRQGREWSSKSEQYEHDANAAPEETKQLEALLQKDIEEEVSIPDAVTVDIAEQGYIRAMSDLDAARKKKTELDEELAQRGEKRRQLPELITDAQKRLADAQKALEAVTGATGELEPDIQRAFAQAQIFSFSEEARCYDVQLSTYEARGKLIRLRLDAAARVVARLEKIAKKWDDTLRLMREEEAWKAVDTAQEALMRLTEVHPRVRGFAQGLAAENANLAARRAGPSGLLKKIENASNTRSRLQGDLDQLRANFRGVTQKIEIAGLNNTTGLLLRKYQKNLPDAGEHRRRIRARRDEIAQVQLDQIEVNEDWLSMTDLNTLVARQLPPQSAFANPKDRDELAKELRSLLQAKRDTLAALDKDYDTYFEKLVDLDSVERLLVDETETFQDFIHERVLWILSEPPLALTDFQNAWHGLQWFFTPHQWKEVFQTAGDELVNEPMANGVALFGFGLLYALRRRAKRWLVDLCGQASKSTCTSFRSSSEALLATVPLALLLPGLTAWIGMRLSGSVYAGAFSRAVGGALNDTALLVLALETLRQILRPHGIAQGHFGWPEGPIRQLRKQTTILMGIAIPLTASLFLIQRFWDEIYQQSLGRLLFLSLMLVFAWYMRAALHPLRGPVMRIRDWRSSGKRGWSRNALYILMVGLPALLFLLTWIGYAYTAYRLATRLYVTVCYALGLLFARSMVLRWVLILRRRMSMDQARRRRELMRDRDENATEEFVLPQEIDLERLDTQTYRLIQSFVGASLIIGLWLIWAQELPALRILDQVKLWDSTQLITVAQGTLPTESKEAGALAAQQVSTPVTLGDLVLAIVMAVLTFVIVADLPGLLDVFILQKFQMGAGERYAVTTIVRYAVTAAGVILVFHTIGIGWSKIQWLVAAVGLGLGFGLQEIFANFISGIILLFERPIRIGDVVTVGGVSGVVSRIRIRATSITDFDRKELIVPNKEFVAGQLVNWTLSDPVVRVVIPVGVAYGSKTDEVERVLVEVAKKTPGVLEDPAPRAFFMAFGPSSLDFELRAFSAVEDALEIRHSLLMRIDQAFREAGIEIAFPQHDVHIRSIQAPLPIIDARKQD